MNDVTMKLSHVLIVLFSLLMTLPIQAHGYIVRAIPEDRSTLQRPPTRLQYWFSEDLEQRFSGINLRNQSGEIIASGGVDDNNQTLLSLQVPPELPDGAYIVELRPAFASDGHVVAESRVFFVGDEVGGVEGQAADDTAIPLEVVWRALLTTANMLIFGVTALYSTVLYPAWGNPKYKAGGLPPRVMTRLRNTLIASLALAIIANLIALMQQSMVFFNATPLQVIEQNLWQIVQMGSRFGDVWTFRMVLLAFTAVLLFVSDFYKDQFPQLTRGIWNGLAWMGALLIGLSMVTSHAAGSLMLPWVALTVNWVHAIAVGFWVGGIMALVLILPVALAPYDGDNRRHALMAVMPRFSRVTTVMVLLVVITGIYNALNWFVTPSDIATSYGTSLGLKLIMVALLLLIGALHHVAIRPQLADQLARVLPSKQLDALIARASTFALTMRLEVVFVLLTLATVALLSATPIPEPEYLKTSVETPSATQDSGDYTITNAVIPGGTGVNTYDTVITQQDRTVSDVTVFLQMVNPATTERSPWYTTEQVDNGLYVAAGDDIDALGTWWTLIDVVDADGNMTRSAFVWDIAEDANVLQSRDPQFIHILVLLTLVGVLLSLAYPTLKKLYLKLNMSLLTGLIAVIVVIGTGAVMAVTGVIIADQQRIYEESLNPPPTITNTVLPSAESIARGETLYATHCLVWQGQSADFRALRNQLDDFRDDRLYDITVNGWRDLPPCEGNLSEAQRWDIINYVRTFEARGD
jgi:putative copper export protein/methionine-rich copper-binding protein CopC/mono/diheme cytochrome c family protein